MRTFAAWLFIAAVTAGLLVWIRQGGLTPQPAPFNHKKHVDFGIACEACHVGAVEAVKATLPPIQTCALCHVPDKETPPTPKSLAAYIRQGKEIPWRKIYQAPPHVTFSHQRHVAMAGLACQTCHGDISRMEKALLRPPVPLEMERCLACHRKEKVTTDCLACHR